MTSVWAGYNSRNTALRISFLEENKTLFFTAIASVTSVFSFALVKLIQFIVVIFLYYLSLLYYIRLLFMDN